MGKGRKQADVYVPKPALRVLSLWLKKMNPNSVWAFPSTIREHPVGVRHLAKRLRDYAKRAGIEKRVYSHLLRHSHATLLVEMGVDMAVVQKILRHSDIRTTELYAQVSQKRQREALDGVFGGEDE